MSSLIRELPRIFPQVPDPRVQRARRRWFAQHHPVLAERVLDATFAEVAEHGLRALTVEAVAVRAGSSRATQR